MNSLFRTNVSKMDVLDKSVAINRTILRAWSAFGAFAQIFNISRLIIFTDSNISTLNSRIYLGFYIFCLVCSIGFLVSDFVFKMSVQTRRKLYMLTGSVYLFWYTFINAFEVYLTGTNERFTNITIITAFIIFSSLLAMKPVYEIINLALSYIIFMIFLSSTSNVTAIINFSFTACLCVIIYIARYKDICFEISQSKMLDDMKSKLEDSQRSLHMSLEQYELIHENGDYITFEWNIKDDCICFSKKIKDYFDYPEFISSFSQQIKNLDSIDEEQKNILIDCIENIKKGVNFQKYELFFPLSTGKSRWFEVRIITQKNSNGEPTIGIGILSDITELKEKITQLEEEIRRDLFTGLLNKTATEYYGERELKNLKNGDLLAMMIIDMDDFKNINDRYGHPAGDHVLKEVANIMRNTAPSGTRIGRIGGDEFIALLVTKDVYKFCNYGNELLSQIPQIRWNDIDLDVNCSIGVAFADSNEYTYFDLYKKTDNALYQAKQVGKKQMKCDFII